MNDQGFFGSLFDLSFNEFVTIKIIKVVFIVIILVAALGALVIMASMFESRSGLGILVGLILGPIVFFIYVILGRIWLEVVIVLFRIAENTRRLVEQGERSSPSPSV